MPASAQHTSEQYRKKALPRVLVRQLLLAQQQRMFASFLEHVAPRPEQRALDVGTNASLQRPELYFFQNLYPYPRQTVSCGLEDGTRFQRCYPGLDYVQVRRNQPLPFGDMAFDLVHCAAVIEHVGSRDQQRTFLRELCRVGRTVFVTTPNRWYPVELHTVLPLLHYLPPELYRPILRALSFEFFSQEANLNLLDRKALVELVPRDRSFEIHRHHFLGFCSNLLLVIR